jgi:hypothetical protein
VYCKQLDAGAFSDEGVVKSADGLIRILVDAGKDEKLFSKYGVKGMPTIIFLDSEGKEIGKLNSREADGVKKQFEDIAAKNTRAPQWLAGVEAAISAAKSGPKPAVLFFFDDKPKSKSMLNLFSDPAFGTDLYEKATFSKVEFKKDSDECKKYKVTEGGTILIVDPSAEEGSSLKSLKAGAPKAVRKEIEDAIKKLAK